MRMRKLLLTGALLVALVPGSAAADWLVTPYIGANTGAPDSDSKLHYGGSVAYMGARVVGFEVDFGYSPNFFRSENDPFELVAESNVTSLMFNAIVGIPIGDQGPSFRPYASGGAGWLRTRVADTDDFFTVKNDGFGLNAGGGFMAFFNERVGLRGDVRYFRNLTDPQEDNEFDIAIGDFDFWRGTVGVTFKF